MDNFVDYPSCRAGQLAFQCVQCQSVRLPNCPPCSPTWSSSGRHGCCFRCCYARLTLCLLLDSTNRTGTFPVETSPASKGPPFLSLPDWQQKKSDQNQQLLDGITNHHLWCQCCRVGVSCQHCHSDCTDPSPMGRLRYRVRGGAKQIVRRCCQA